MHIVSPKQAQTFSLEYRKYFRHCAKIVKLREVREHWYD